MKLKSKLLIGLLAGCAALVGNAQDTEGVKNPWFVQGGLGMSYSVGGHAGLGELLTPAGQIAVGKQFMPQLSARLATGGWRGKAYNDARHQVMGFYHWQTTVDGLWNISQTFAVNEKRPVDVNFILGIGFDREFTYNVSSFLARAGVGMDVRLCKAIDFNLEATFNGVSDHWNHRNNGAFDKFVNVLVGVTYKFGTGYKCKSCETPKPVCNERINEMRQPKVVHDTVTIVVEKEVAPVVEAAVVAVKAEPMKREVFFAINQTKVSANQMNQVADIARYLEQNPSAKVSVTGFADRGTGTAEINIRLAQKRADAVADLLMNKYGISSTRIDVTSMENTADQPFAQNDKNRVVLMVAE